MKYFREKEFLPPLSRPQARENLRDLTGLSRQCYTLCLGCPLWGSSPALWSWTWSTSVWPRLALCNAELLTDFHFDHLKVLSFLLHPNTSRLGLRSHWMAWLTCFSLPCIVHYFICTHSTSLGRLDVFWRSSFSRLLLLWVGHLELSKHFTVDWLELDWLDHEKLRSKVFRYWKP